MIQESDLVGKTIKSVDVESVNFLKIDFTDGTTLDLWTEDVVHTQVGTVAGIFVDDGNNLD